jgi:transposase-like protein/ribosomal protein L37AE/L43A
MNKFTITEDFPNNEAEFNKRFCEETNCEKYLFNYRWPEGFICPKCGFKSYWKTAKGLYMCQRCESQHSITAQTIMHGTRHPLTLWFKAMWWFTTKKSGFNAVDLQNYLGLGSYTTAWSWLQKLRCCTIRSDREKLSGTIEVDEFYLGGQRSGKRGRGAEHKYPVAVAVEKKGKKLGRLRLQVIEDCSESQLSPFIHANVEPGSKVLTDGWKGYNFFEDQKYEHHTIIASKAKNKESVLPGVHLIASLVNRLITGTFQGRFEKKYLQQYLDEYVFRFNRRNTKSIGKRFFRIVQQAMVAKPLSLLQIKLGMASLSLAN